MLARLVFTGLVTLGAAPPVLAAGSGTATVIRLDYVDANNPSDIQRALRAFRSAGRNVCAVSGSRIVKPHCIDEFVGEAIMAVKREQLRFALMESAGMSGAGTEMAGAQRE